MMKIVFYSYDVTDDSDFLDTELVRYNLFGVEKFSDNIDITEREDAATDGVEEDYSFEDIMKGHEIYNMP